MAYDALNNANNVVDDEVYEVYEVYDALNYAVDNAVNDEVYEVLNDEVSHS